MALPFPSLSFGPLPPLADHELHVWRASLALSDAARDAAEAFLTADENSRARKFLVPEARDHFVGARTLLRQLLSYYSGIAPSEIAFSFGAKEKPALSLAHHSKIHFNISHSHGMGLLAFAHDHELGVDIEKIRDDFGGMEIAHLFFAPQEAGQLAKLPPEAQSSAFFHCWTRKEAYIKARGGGMSIPLHSFSVDFADTRAQQIRDESGMLWSCYDLQLPRGFAGAVVAEGEGWRVKQFEWTPSEAPFYREVRD